MVEVKIESKVGAIPIAAPMGAMYYQRTSYSILRIAESNQILAEGRYQIKQGDTVKMCRVMSDGAVKGLDWINKSLPLYMSNVDG